MISKEVYMDIKAMHRRGMSMRAIARQLGIHRNTVKRHLESDSFPEYRKRKRKESILDRYKQVIDDYLAEEITRLLGSLSVLRPWDMRGRTRRFRSMLGEYGRGVPGLHTYGLRQSLGIRPRWIGGNFSLMALKFMPL